MSWNVIIIIFFYHHLIILERLAVGVRVVILRFVIALLIFLHLDVIAHKLRLLLTRHVATTILERLVTPDRLLNTIFVLYLLTRWLRITVLSSWIQHIWAHPIIAPNHHRASPAMIGATRSILIRSLLSDWVAVVRNYLLLFAKIILFLIFDVLVWKRQMRSRTAFTSSIRIFCQRNTASSTTPAI